MSIARVLLVEDDEPLRNSLCALLRDNGYEVLAYPDPATAIDAIKVSRAEMDLVITDICMPRMNGLRFLELMKRSFPVVPVIVITGCDEHDLCREALSKGATDYLCKPLVPENLLREIRSALNEVAEWMNPLLHNKGRDETRVEQER